MEEPTEGRALTGKCAELVWREFKVIHLPRDQVALEEEFRDIEAVVDILRHQRDFNSLINWNNELWVVLRCSINFKAFAGIPKLPLPLISNDFHLYRNLFWLTGINNTEHLG